jgi:NADPH:quinone reductase-like Zn-dependent oxidoreductase
LVFGELPMPQPQAGEVRVQVYTTAVTPTEFEWYPTFNTPAGGARPFPIVSGHEFSGIVSAVGAGVTGLRVGDAVYGLNDWFGNGANADFCIAPAAALAPKPVTLSHAQAAVVPISALTAWQALIGRGRVQPGQRVLVHGAAGAVGVFAVQLAHHLGAHVIATASAGNLDFVRSLGADEVIDYRAARFENAVVNVDFVFDGVGGDTLARSWGVLSPGGKLVTIATSSSGSADARIREAFMLVETNRAQLVAISGLLESGTLRAHVAAEYPLVEAQAAYARAQRGGLRGKIALHTGQ